MNTIKVANKVLMLCAVKAEEATKLSLEEVRDLVAWCRCQDESLWDVLTLQEILNVYRVSAEYETFEAWLGEEPTAAVAAWNTAIINPENTMVPRTSEWIML